MSGGQFHHEEVKSTISIFLSGAHGASSEANRRQFHQEKVISTIYFSLTAMDKLGGSQGFLVVLRGSQWQMGAVLS